MDKIKLLTCEKIEIIENCKKIIHKFESNNTTDISENDIIELNNCLTKMNIISNSLHTKLIYKKLYYNDE